MNNTLQYVIVIWKMEEELKRWNWFEDKFPQIPAI